MFSSFLFFPFVFSRDFSLSISGSGLHRSLHVTIPANSTSALLKWDITPDFYVDVYELDRHANKISIYWHFFISFRVQIAAHFSASKGKKCQSHIKNLSRKYVHPQHYRFRQKFEFRVDDDDTKFIDIESPAHRSEFHRLSLNVERKSVTGTRNFTLQAGAQLSKQFFKFYHSVDKCRFILDTSRRPMMTVTKVGVIMHHVRNLIHFSESLTI